jgi:hypothetical protein
MPKEHLNMMFGEGMDLNLSREERERGGDIARQRDKERGRYPRYCVGMCT